MALRLLAGAIALSLAASAAPAHAASGITPLSPRSGATVPSGQRTTFKMRVKGSGQVWVRVCNSPKRSSEGLICSTAQMGHASKGAGGVFTFRSPFFDTPAFWLNVPGTYYWQAQRSLQPGPIVKFKVG